MYLCIHQNAHKQRFNGVNISQGRQDLPQYHPPKADKSAGATGQAGYTGFLFRIPTSEFNSFRIPISLFVFRIPHSDFRIQLIPHSAFRIPTSEFSLHGSAPWVTFSVSL
jgi:hypothetical protein